MRIFLRRAFLPWGPVPLIAFLFAAAAVAQQDPPAWPTPRPEPVQPVPAAPGLRRVTLEPTPTPTPTPLVRPHLIAALETTEGRDTERVALFDDGTLAFTQSYRGRRTLKRKEVTSAEIDLLRRVLEPALQSPASLGMRERPLADSKGRQIRIEVTDAAGRAKTFVTDDWTALPLAVGRAKAALEDLRSRFFETDPKETPWDPKNVKKGDLLRNRSSGTWYVVIRDDSFEPSLEMQETGGLRNEMLISRGQIPKLFENPADSGPPPPARTPER
jgi:hypothetical protein